MGDRTYIPTTCPECGAKYHIYDQPTALCWSNKCDKCGWHDGMEYIEVGINTIELRPKV